MSPVRIYIEGGAKGKQNARPLRMAFSEWFRRALGRAPDQGGLTIVMSGGRHEAYKDFRKALKIHKDSFCVLLVDSEELRTSGQTRWEQAQTREGDNFVRPKGVTEEQLHFMVVMMETWLCADLDALEAHFGPGFHRESIPRHVNLEEVDKPHIYSSLESAVRKTRFKEYKKGSHFTLLGKVSPELVMKRCPHAQVLVDLLRKKLS